MRRIINKFLILLLIFCAVLGGYGVIRYRANKAETAKEANKMMGSATLPVVRTILGSYDTNELHGYIMEMDQRYMHESTIVLAGRTTLEMNIAAYKQSVTAMQFEVTDPETGEVVTSDEDMIWEQIGDSLDTEVLVDGLNPDTEYYFKLTMSTENENKIYYYAIIKYESSTESVKQLDFAEKFSKGLLSYDEAAKFVIPYIEPSATNPNDNLGEVDITSSLKQLTWQNMKVERVGSPTYIINDVTKDAVCATLKYQIKSKNDFDVEEIYNIEEYFRICTYNTRMYLSSYHRTANQLYDSKSANVAANRLNLGIDSDQKVEFLASDSSNYISFVNEGSLYMMDIRNNEVTVAFTFLDSDDDGVRDGYNNHDIKIIKTSNEGDIDFLVYGYMNRGEHEGRSGVTLYQYHKETNKVEEKVYIPSSKPYQMLKQVVGKLCYITENNSMYIYLDNNIYSVDIPGREYVAVVNNVGEQDYCISTTGDMLAWRDGNNIRILDLKTSEEQSINGDDKGRIIPLGFIGTDFVYGHADNVNIYKDKYGDETVLMSKLYIVNESLEKIKEYTKKGYFFIDVIVNDSIINVDLAKKVETKNNSLGYKDVKDDQIISNSEVETQSVSKGTISTDLKEKQLIIKYANSVISAEETKVITADEIMTASSNAMAVKDENSDEGHYYVYGYGKLISITKSKAKAKDSAKAVKGFVIDSKGLLSYEYTETFKAAK